MEEGGRRREGGREGEGGRKKREQRLRLRGFFEGIGEFTVYFCFFAMGHSFTSLNESTHKL